MGGHFHLPDRDAEDGDFTRRYSDDLAMTLPSPWGEYPSHMPPKDSSSSPDLFAGVVEPTARIQTTAKDLVAAQKLVKKFAGSEKKSGRPSWASTAPTSPSNSPGSSRSHRRRETGPARQESRALSSCGSPTSMPAPIWSR